MLDQNYGDWRSNQNAPCFYSSIPLWLVQDQVRMMMMEMKISYDYNDGYIVCQTGYCCFLSFLRIMMGGNLKSPAITRNKIFCVKNVAFLPNHKVFWVKMYLKSNIRYAID